MAEAGTHPRRQAIEQRDGQRPPFDDRFAERVERARAQLEASQRVMDELDALLAEAEPRTKP